MFEDNKKQQKRYVLYEASIKDILQKCSDTSENVSAIDLFKYEADDRELSEYQLEKQHSNTWTTKPNIDMSLGGPELEEFIKREAQGAMLSKYRGDIAEKIRDNVYNAKLKACIRFVNRKDGKFAIDKYVKTSLDTKEEYEKDIDIEYSYDMDELRKKLNEVKLDYTYHENGPDDFVYVDEITVYVYRYRAKWMKDTIDKLIKRTIKNDLVYCLKKGKSIVPDEYLDKGKSGIEEWQHIKRSANKNNSLDKQILREELRNRKEYMCACIETVTRDIVNVNFRWDLPSLDVEGRWNKGKVRKQAMQLLEGKTDDQIMEMSNEEILNVVKGHWKKMLMDAYNNICNSQCIDKSKNQ